MKGLFDSKRLEAYLFRICKKLKRRKISFYTSSK